MSLIYNIINKKGIHLPPMEVGEFSLNYVKIFNKTIFLYQLMIKYQRSDFS